MEVPLCGEFEHMPYINHTIRGAPFCKSKNRGDKRGPERWTVAIKEQTAHLPKIKEACLMRVTFLLPRNRFPADFPYGPDLDNLLKRFLDALNETVFSEAAGRDSCVVAITAMKTQVGSEGEAGANFEIFPVKVG